MTAVVEATVADRARAVLPLLREQARDVDDKASFPDTGLKALRESGLMGLLVPTTHGGLGGGLAELAETAGTLAGGCLSTAMIWAMHCQQVGALARHADPSVREWLLPKVAAGDRYLASVTSEKGKGGHLLTASAPLHRRDGHLIVRRDAPIVTGALAADGFLITMRDGPTAPDNAVTLVYAERSELEVRLAGSWDPMGMRGTHSVAVRLDGTVPGDRVIGAPGQFKAVATSSFVPAGHIGWTACWLGGARAAFREVLELLRSPQGRRQHDLGSDLLRQRLGRVRMDLDAMAAVLAQTVHDVEHCEDPEAIPVQLRLNALKVFTAERAFAVVDSLMDVVGLRHAYLRDAPLSLERLFRDLRSASLNYANDRLLQANGALALFDREVTLVR